MNIKRKCYKFIIFFYEATMRDTVLAVRVQHCRFSIFVGFENFSTYEIRKKTSESEVVGFATE